MLRFFLSRYNRWSLVAIAFMAALFVIIPLVWTDLFRLNLHVINWFLIVIWVFMTALLCWDVQPAQDIALAVVALAGGFLFEGWGTHTGLWHYFTGDKPPLWILPAWPVAALATARIAFLLDRLFLGRTLDWRIPYWLFVLVFAVGMGRFIRPSIGMVPTWVTIAVVVLAIVTGRAPRRDVSLLAAGVALGYFLEYWGTSRNCWTYYTGQIPPPVTVMAHGFAQVVFARTLSGLDRVLGRLGVPWTVRARDGADLKATMGNAALSCKPS
jgi:hypothetical protein